MTSVAPEAFTAARSLEDIYRLLPALNIENGWAKPTPSMWARPKETFLPAHWAYPPAKAALAP